MAITRDQKTEILEELKQKFQKSKGVVFAQYRGLSVMDAQSIRRGLRESNIDYKVAKKTLIKLAAKESGVEIPDTSMEGPIGVAFGYDDEVAAAQKMADFAKKFESVQLAGGIMEGKAIDAAMVKQLASIPSREVLLAKLLGSMMAPLSGFVGVGNALVGGLVRVVARYQEKKAEGVEAPVVEAAVETTPEAPTEAPVAEPVAEATPEATEEAAPEEAAVPAPTEESAPEETPEA